MADSVARVESAKPVKSKIENLRYGEDLMEALNMADDFKFKVEQYGMEMEDFENKPGKKEEDRPKKPDTMDLYFGGKSIYDFILGHLKMIPRAELEGTLKFLPYTYVERFLFYLEHFIRKVTYIETKRFLYRIRKLNCRLSACTSC